MNGYELAKHFRELRPHTPIIFLSGDVHAKDAHVGFSPATTILKPPSPDILVKVVREMLSNFADHEHSQ
jgi:DNA-binding response OmpR family regulator